MNYINPNKYENKYLSPRYLSSISSFLTYVDKKVINGITSFVVNTNFELDP